MTKARSRTWDAYHSHLYSESKHSPLRVQAVAAAYAPESELVDGRQILRAFWLSCLEQDPRIVIVGEDVGTLGDVNLVFEDLLTAFGPLRVVDTGVREATILGQGIGAALRGLRPVVDIQYVDYLLYAMETAADDLAGLRWRTAGGQMAPVVIRTKGHRLQGIWHAGSPLGMILTTIPGVHVCVPRNMTDAAGMYSTLLSGDDPGIVVEVLNGYRRKERMPINIGELKVRLGTTTTLRAGSDLTIATYGATCPVVLDATEHLAEFGVDAEVIDIRTLRPLDVDGSVGRSVRRTRALLIVDEDVPGGASAYLLRQFLEEQGLQDIVDVPARTLSAKDHRTPVGRDGDYATKPSVEDVIDMAYAMARERDPRRLRWLNSPDQ